MKQIFVWLGFLFVSVSFGGCAFTQANLNIGYDEAKASKGPLSSIQSLRAEVGPFTDKRPERDKIGYKRNGYGMKTADIVTTKPVPDIVREAFVAELKKNGHLISATDKDIILSGEINSLWFDAQINFWTIEFMGTVSVKLSLTHGKTGAVLLTAPYQGHYNEKSMGGLEGTWERVMNAALERMVNEVSTDPKLLQVLKSVSSDGSVAGKRDALESGPTSTRS